MSNSISPFLYHANDYLEMQKADQFSKRYGNHKEDEEKKPSGFFTQISESIRKELPENLRYQMSSSRFNTNMRREDIVRDAQSSPEKKKLFDASMEFEAFFVEKMFAEMQKSVPKTKLFHGGQAEDIFQDLLLAERSRAVSKQSNFGLAEKMYEQLSQA